MAPHRNHVEARSSRAPARQFVSETHDHKPTLGSVDAISNAERVTDSTGEVLKDRDAIEQPDFYSCIQYEFDEIILAMTRMQETAKQMRSNFDGRHDVALKLSLEDFAKKAEQARSMSNHLAGVMVRRINRRPR